MAPPQLFKRMRDKLRGRLRISFIVFQYAAAFIFSLLGSISLPLIPALDIVRVNFNNPPPRGVQQTDFAKQLRIYVWGFCSENALSGKHTCSSAGLGYYLDLKSSTAEVHIAPSLTSVLGVHLAVTLITFILLAYIIFCLSKNKRFGDYPMFLPRALVLALLCTITTLVVDITVTVTVVKKIKQLGIGTSASIGFGFGATIVSALFIIPISGFSLYSRYYRVSKNSDQRILPSTMTNFDRIFPEFELGNVSISSHT